MRDEYQGWTNYETYVVSLEFDNNQGYWAQRVSELLDDPPPSEVLTSEQAATFALADELKEQIELGNPLEGVGTAYETLLQGAIDLVVWDELAAHLIGKVQDVATNA